MWKRRLMTMTLIGVACGLMLSLSGCPCIGGPFLIRDQALESVIRASLGKPFGCLTQSELLTVTELQAANLNIRNLEGIQYLPNLLVLNLQGNAIQSITPLQDLRNLTFLDLGYNQVGNLQALAGLSFLEDLYLDGNPILNLSPLVANVNNGGMVNAVVVLPETILDSSGGILDIFLDDIKALQDAGVEVWTGSRPEGSQ